MRWAALLAVLVCAGCGGGAAGTARVAAPAAADDGAPAPDLALRDQDGRLVRLSALRGRVVVLTFLYTGCPEVCPALASTLSTAVRSLPRPARDGVRVLAVSVDPRGDTPAAVRRFVGERRLVPQFRYLTGTRAQLAPVWQAWNVLVEPRNLERIAHSSLVWVIDAQGRTRFSYGEPDAATVARAIARLDWRARGRRRTLGAGTEGA